MQGPFLLVGSPQAIPVLQCKQRFADRHCRQASNQWKMQHQEGLLLHTHTSCTHRCYHHSKRQDAEELDRQPARAAGVNQQVISFISRAGRWHGLISWDECVCTRGHIGESGCIMYSLSHTQGRENRHWLPVKSLSMIHHILFLSER